MDISQEGIDLIKKFEGFAAKPYICLGGKLTIGYGHVIKEDERDLKTTLLTLEQGEDILRKDIIIVVNYLNSIIKKYDIPYVKNKSKVSLCFSLKVINQNMFNALCSFSFNTGAFSTHMLKRFEVLDLEEVGKSLILYIKAKGKELPGLVKRRKAEQELYFRNY